MRTTTGIDKKFKMTPVPHVGEMIREDLLRQHDLSVTEAAALLRVSRVTLSRLANEQAGLSAEMALRVERVFGVHAATLLRWQAAYDLDQAQRSVKLDKVKPFKAA